MKEQLMEQHLTARLLALNVNEHTKEKNKLTYLSWAWAWQQMLNHCPTATYTVTKNTDGTPLFGNSKMGYMCYTTVTADGITHEMWLPVMNHMNKAILEPNMFEVNKTVMRCLTKNLAMFGLGLYIYAGEDLPDGEEPPKPQPKQVPKTQPKLEPQVMHLTPDQLSTLIDLTDSKGVSHSVVAQAFKKTAIDYLTVEDYGNAILKLSAKADKQ